MQIRPVGAEVLHADGQTDMLKPTVVFRSIANVPKKTWYQFARKVGNDIGSALVCRQWRTQDIFFRGGSTNSVDDRGQRERGSGGDSPLVRGSA
jgi:hypothetical protein